METKEVKLTEKEISLIKLTLEHTNFEKGGKLTNELIEKFTELHKQILTKIHK
jgi:hypothetical protein